MTHRRFIGVDREIVLDICHLSLGFWRETPAGVDRVDASFAAHFLSADDPNRKALLFTPLGPRAIPIADARRIFEGVQIHWGETKRSEEDRAFCRVRDALMALPPSQPRRPQNAAIFYRFGKVLRVGAKAAILHFGAWGRIAAIGANAVYLNVSQYPLSSPSYFRWLQERPDVKPVFMIHDLLPIQYPEFFHPASVKRHARRLSVFAKIAAGAIVSTPAVADALLAYLKRLGRKTLPLLIQALPASPTFHRPREHDEGLAARPYFIICGTIEPRKNHLLLLNLWRELARLSGFATPKLIVAGARGWENENIVDMLERCPAIRDHVIEASGLSTPSLKRLIDNARAVLMPSFAEGYGLPVAEALAAGTPVLASDLPSLRAIGGSAVTWLDPVDGLGWLAAIRRLSEAPAHWVQGGRDRPRSALADETYFQQIEAFLSTV
ncbi:MAG TPA: glycosyltransferase family 1 protein [Stellaceae bacterium]|jgi:glycosyltransferase involved in cell wall biosynthesis|nr:glycosyltransferase family 1 protein [Stellaceae bacterium]